MRKIFVVLLFMLLVFSLCNSCLAGQPDEDRLIRRMVNERVWGNYRGYDFFGPFYSDYPYSCSPYPYYPYYGTLGVFSPQQSVSPYPTNVQPASRVIVNINPEDAEVYLDGLRLQQLPDLSYQIVLLVGEHQLTAKKAGYKDYVTTLKIPGGSGILVPINMEPETKNKK